MKSIALKAVLAAALSQHAYAADPLPVEFCELSKYWNVREGRIETANPRALLADPGKGWALLEYTIQSNGKVSNVRIVKSSGNDKFNQRNIAFSAAISFLPSASNKTKTSVRTQMFVASRGNTDGDKHRPQCKR
jgi:TonB family protein